MRVLGTGRQVWIGLALLGREDRAILDDGVCGTDDEGTSEADTMGTGQLADVLRRRAEEADPAAAVRRAAKAEEARRVSIRPTPDTMVYLTGQTHAEDVGVTVDVMISDQTLLGGGNASAVLPGAPGAGSISAQIAREIIAHALRAETVSWTRSLCTDPSGRLIAMSTKQRFVTPGLADYLTIRDQGLCQACNLAKQATGWTQRTVDDDAGRHTVETATPTGHRHRSRAPHHPHRRDDEHRDAGSPTSSTPEPSTSRSPMTTSPPEAGPVGAAP